MKRLDDRSRMKREFHVRFCESLRGKYHGLLDWFDLVGGKITGFDYNLWASAKLNKAETLATLKYTLDLRLQNGNRAPFMFGAHTDYFGSKNAALFGQISVRERQEVMEQFIAYAQSKPEVRIVPFNSIVNWMRNPSAIDCSYNCPTPSLPPEVTNPGNQLNKVGDVVKLAIQASDPNGFSLTITAENLPTGLAIDSATGLISGIVTTESSNAVTIKVNNGEQTSTTTFNWKIEADTPADLPPVVTNPGNQSNGIADVVELTIQAKDPNNFILEFTAENLPTGLSINSVSGLISGTVTRKSAKTVTINVNNQ